MPPSYLHASDDTRNESLVTVGGLTYNNSTFDATTSNGFLAIGAQGQSTPSANFNNFGSFTLSGLPEVYNGMNSGAGS